MPTGRFPGRIAIGRTSRGSALIAASIVTTQRSAPASSLHCISVAWCSVAGLVRNAST
jgi:hypothetical protein